MGHRDRDSMVGPGGYRAQAVTGSGLAGLAVTVTGRGQPQTRTVTVTSGGGSLSLGRESLGEPSPSPSKSDRALVPPSRGPTRPVMTAQCPGLAEAAGGRRTVMGRALDPDGRTRMFADTR